jgi:uncharacterized protein YneF (UPF0154 family)
MITIILIIITLVGAVLGLYVRSRRMVERLDDMEAELRVLRGFYEKL